MDFQCPLQRWCLESSQVPWESAIPDTGGGSFLFLAYPLSDDIKTSGCFPCPVRRSSF